MYDRERGFTGIVMNCEAGLARGRLQSMIGLASDGGERAKPADRGILRDMAKQHPAQALLPLPGADQDRCFSAVTARIGDQRTDRHQLLVGKCEEMRALSVIGRARLGGRLTVRLARPAEEAEAMVIGTGAREESTDQRTITLLGAANMPGPPSHAGPSLVMVRSVCIIWSVSLIFRPPSR
ncbi:MAG: hypothetical protein EOP61_36160 [Sphingomonadales bacterium]|nr:MAG: hypothetical protein EOP61_36160 [Sphingomonadales bacterium]